MLGDNLVDAYMWLPTGKETWDALEAKFRVSNAGNKLYVIESSSMTTKWLMAIL